MEALHSSEKLVTFYQQTQHDYRGIFMGLLSQMMLCYNCAVCPQTYHKSYKYEIFGVQQWWYGDWATGLMICCSNPTGASSFFETSKLVVRPTQFPIQLVSGYLSQGLKWPGLAVNHSPPYSTEAKNVWGFTSTPYVFMTCTRIT
jgi:hypothetical protein